MIGPGHRPVVILTWLVTCLGSACGQATTAPPVDPGDPADAAVAEPADVTGTPQRPPVGQTALETWLAAGHHRLWACETGIFGPRLTGNHGRHRICSNDLLRTSENGPYPVGAASVKELFSAADQPNGFAVGLKVAAGTGAKTWYWYERRGPSPGAAPLAQGSGVPECAVCHNTAVRDHVFITAVAATSGPEVGP